MEPFAYPKRPDRFWRLALHVATKREMTRNELRADYLNRLVPSSQNLIIQDTIRAGYIESVKVDGQREHLLRPTTEFRRVLFAHQHGFSVNESGEAFVGKRADEATRLFARAN